ncbi:MAG: hypothetical protein JWN38_478 [Candidatus Saccharibacteria bacterium]|nr:hypothetical protein [Candidatus Saccharibacteria bacterium]
MNTYKNVIRLMNCIVLGGMLFIGVQLFRAAEKTEHLAMHVTSLAVIYFVAALVMAVLLVVLRLRANRSRSIFWFTMYTASVTLFMASSGLMAASADQATYVYWYHLLGFTSTLVGPMFLAFVIAYVDRQDLLYRPVTWFAVFGSIIVVSPLLSGGTLLADPSKTVLHTFGYPNTAPIGPAGAGNTALSLALLLTGMVLLVLHYRQVKSITSRRKQARILVVGTVVPMTLAYLAVGLLPLFGHVLPAEPFLSVLQVMLIGYALIRYKLFSIDPTALASTILETVNEAVVTIDARKEIEYLNEAALHILGVSLKKVRGHRINSIFDDKTARLVLHSLQRDAAQSSAELNLHVGDKDIPIGLATSKIFAKGNKDSIEGYVLVFRDISKEQAIKKNIESLVVERTQQLNTEHAKLQAAMDGLSVGLLMTFKDSEAITYNAMLPVILGGKSHPAHPHGKLSLATLGERLKASEFDLIAAIEKCQEAGVSFDAKELTYGDRILRIYGAPIGHHSSAAIGAVAMVEDITEAKIIERSRDEFFSIASHELRTPLTSIKGNTSMILGYYPEALKDNNLKEMINDIHSSSVRLIEVVNDFLDVSRLEQSKISFNYESVSLEEVVESIVYEMQVVLKDKGLYLKQDKPTLDRLPHVWVDKNRLKQVIYNLLGNAAKFTQEGGITLNAEVDGDMLKVLVIDTGHGMTPASQQLLFRKFQQASSSILTRDTTRGTGLGLYISKMIVESMGGHIQLEKSVEGEGTTFSFTVPIDTPDRQAATAATASQTDTATGLSVASK